MLPVTPGPLAPSLQKDFPEIKNTVRFGSWGGILKNTTHIFEQKNIQLTDNSIFSVFNFPLIKGDAKTALKQPDEIVITEDIAVQYFGKDWKNNPSVVGQTFRLNNETDFKLAGIVKNLPANSSISFDVLLPLSYLFNSDEFSNKWNSNNYHTYIQLNPGTNLNTFSNKIKEALHIYNPDTKDQLLLQPLTCQYLYSTFDFKTDWGIRSDIKYIKIFSGIGLLLLIIACVNFINLSTARSRKRSMEVGIRKVNGATRTQLIFQFLSESVVLCFIAGVLALVVVVAAMPLLQSALGVRLNINIIQPGFIGFFAGFILVVGCIAGIYPAFILSGFKPISVLKKLHIASSGKLFRQSLVVTQFAIAIALIICTFFMYGQFRFISKTDLGFNKDALLKIRLGGTLATKADLFKHEVESLPGVVAATPTTISMVNVDNSSNIEWEGMQGKRKK